MEDGRRGWAVGRYRTILATRNGGATWTFQEIGTSSNLESVHFATPEIGWVVGKRGTILVTPNGGVTWTPQTSGSDRRLYGVHFASPKTGWVVGELGTILATRNGGATWTPQTSGTEQNLFDVHFVGPETGWAVGSSVTILATRDGGATWTLQSSSRGGRDFILYGVHLAGHETGWAVGERGTILATSDGGESWQPLENYRRHPAPWVYLAWLGAFGCVLAAARKPPIDLERAPQSVADRLASDRPLELGDPDPLGYQPIAAGLSRFLRNEKTEPPLTVAITGEWGSGKSSLMNLVRADLERYEFRPVWFNAWHHQKEEHLFAALLEAVRGQAVPGWWSHAGSVFRWRLLRKRTRAHLFWSLVLLGVFGISLGAMVDRWPEVTAALRGQFTALPQSASESEGIVERLSAWSTSLVEGLGVGSPLFGLLSGLIGLWVALRNRLATWQLSPAKLMASIGDRTEIKALDAQLGFRRQFAAAFREVCEALHPRTLTIVIDDLDRCRPQQVVETLEAVNFLVTAGPCYVILGIAPEQVMRCVGLGFKDIAAEMAAANVHTEDEGRAWRREFAKNYLEKLINVEVPVPMLTSEDARKMVAAAGDDEEPHRLERRESSSWIAACLALLFISALYAGANVDDWLQPPSVSEVAGTPAPVDSIAAPTDRVATTIAPYEETAQPSEPANGAYFREGKQAEAPWWSWQVPLVSLIVFGGLVLLIHALRREDPVVRDSKDFNDALDIWVPVVLARTRSPRAVKRFVNRVRYYAMCEARPEPTPTWKERLFELLGRRPRPAPATQTSRLPETLLVALGAIKEWRPEMLTTAEHLDVHTTLGAPAPGRPSDDTVLSAVQRHAEAFGAFSPRASEIERFRAVAAGVTVR